jgi:hypothetical protein
MKIPPIGAESLHAVRKPQARADRHDDAHSRFSQLCEKRLIKLNLRNESARWGPYQVIIGLNPTRLRIDVMLVTVNVLRSQLNVSHKWPQLTDVAIEPSTVIMSYNNTDKIDISDFRNITHVTVRFLFIQSSKPEDSLVRAEQLGFEYSSAASGAYLSVSLSVTQGRYLTSLSPTSPQSCPRGLPETRATNDCWPVSLHLPYFRLQHFLYFAAVIPQPVQWWGCATNDRQGQNIFLFKASRSAVVYTQPPTKWSTGRRGGSFPA